jgi:hypothetical protein
MSTIRNLVRTIVAVAVRPDLWTATVRLMFRLLPDRWWREPLPSREYVEYRGGAVYGMPVLQIPPADFIRYLEWCKAFPGPIS